MPLCSKRPSPWQHSLKQKVCADRQETTVRNPTDMQFLSQIPILGSKLADFQKLLLIKDR